MKKQRLQTFLQKYYLNGLVESTLINCKDKQISTDFITQDRSMLGHVKFNDVDIEDGTFGIYDTTQFNKLVSVLDNDIEVHVVKIDDKPINLSMVSGGTKVTALLADTSVIPDVPKLNQLPNFEMELTCDDDFIAKFIRAKSALPEAETFTVIVEGENVKFVLGMSNTNTNRISLPVKVKTLDALMDNKVINADHFKEILSNNKGCTPKIELAEAGLMKISYNDNDFSATYFLKTIDNE